MIAKRGSVAKNNQQVEVYGAWFRLADRDRIMPVEQLEEEGEEEEGEEEEVEEEHGQRVDSSDEDEQLHVTAARVAGSRKRCAIDSSDED